MLNVKVTGLLFISMLPMALYCNLFADIINFYANIKKKLSMESQVLGFRNSEMLLFQDA